MSTARLQERQIEDARKSRAERDQLIRKGQHQHAGMVSQHEDQLDEKVHKGLWDNTGFTEEQEIMHELGCGINTHAPKGGWPQFDAEGRVLHFSISFSRKHHAKR